MAYSAVASGSSTGSASVSLTAPTIPAHARLYYVATSDVGSLTWTAPSGFTLWGVASCSYDGQTLVIFEKLDADGTESGTTLTATTSGNAFDKRADLFVFTGRDNSAATTFAASASAVNTPLSSPANLDATGGTAADGDDILVAYALDKEAAANTWTVAADAAYTERTDNDGTTWAQLSCDTKDAVSAGALGTITAVATRTVGSGSTGYVAFVVAIPAAAASTGPTISAQPSNAHVLLGATASFSVTAAPSGGGTLSYQWKVGGVNVSTGSGGTTANYTTAATALADDNTSYTCVVTETGGTNDGSLTSSAATLRVGVIYVAASAAVYSTSGGTSVAPTYPAGLAAGDRVVVFLGQKPSSANGGTATTPASPWGLDASRTGANDGDTGGYTTTLGADTGNCNIYAFSEEATGSESGSLAITVGTNGVCWALMVLLRKPPGTTWSVAATTGKDTSAGNLSITGAADPGVTAGDYVLAAMVQPTDVTTPAQFSAEAFSQTGVTFGTVIEVEEPDSTVGNDIGGLVFGAPVSAGPSSAAPTFTATAGGTTTNVRGPGIFLRLRAASGGNLAASLSAGATFSSTLTATGALSASCSGSAALSGTLPAKGDLAASLSAGATLSATGLLIGALVAALSGGATVSGTLPAQGALAAALSGSATVSASLGGATSLAAALTGGSTCAGSLAAVGALGASCSGGASLSATAGAGGAIAANCGAGATLTGTIAGTATAAASLGGGAALTGTLPASGALACSLAAGATCSGSLGGVVAISATLTGGAVCAGALTATGALSAACSGGAALAGALTGKGALASALSAGATLTGTAIDGTGLSAALAGGSTCSGTLTGRAACLAPLSAGASATGTLTGKGALAASLTGSAATSGSLVAIGGLSASLSAGATCSGTLGSSSAQSATLTAGAACSGTLTGKGALAAALGGGAVASGTMSVTGELGCSASGGASCSGTLGGIGAVQASLGAGGTITGTLAGRGDLAVSLQGGATCIGTTQTLIFAALGGGAVCSGSLLQPGQYSRIEGRFGPATTPSGAFGVNTTPSGSFAEYPTTPSGHFGES